MVATDAFSVDCAVNITFCRGLFFNVSWCFACLEPFVVDHGLYNVHAAHGVRFIFAHVKDTCRSFYLLCSSVETVGTLKGFYKKNETSHVGAFCARFLVCFYTPILFLHLAEDHPHSK